MTAYRTVTIQEAILTDLQNRYQKSSLNKKELAKELSVSVSSVNNSIVKGAGIPEYKKLGDAKNARVVFPIVCVAEYLSNTVLVA